MLFHMQSYSEYTWEKKKITQKVFKIMEGKAEGGMSQSRQILETKQGEYLDWKPLRKILQRKATANHLCFSLSRER